MIRLEYLLRRKPGMSRDEFQDYWKNSHGPLVASFSTALGIQRYVQVHTIDDPGTEAAQKARGGMEPHYDGVAELWWDNEDSLVQAMNSDAGAAAGEALLDDERRFIDLANSPLWFAYEYPQVNPTPENIVARPRSNIVKVQFPLRHLRSLDEQSARHYWLTNHGPLIRSHAPASGLLCYRQVHNANHPLEAALRQARGTVVDGYLGHAEVWIDRSRAPSTDEARAAGRAAVEDEAKFIDFSRSTLWLAKEHVFIDRRP